MGRRMNNAPVYFTACQVHHNPLLSLQSYVAGIQESMRKSGYPDFKTVPQVTFNLLVNASGQEGAHAQTPTQPPAQKLEQYVFLNAQGTSGYVLLPQALSFQTTEYDTFTAFAGELRKGLQVLNEAVGGLSFVERVGLRYLDAVVPRKGESVREYLEAEVLGLPRRLPDRLFSYSFAESLLVAEGVGQVVSRTIIQNAPLGFPPDLHPLYLKLAARFQAVSGEHAIIDSDGSLAARKPFDLDELQSSLTAIHGLVEKTFEATATDHARAVWHEKGNS